MVKPSFFQDHSQNFWQLASIQAASVSFTGLLLGGQLAAEFGAPTALLSIAFGNLVLWVVGMTMISMSSSQQNPVFQNVIQYFGKGIGIISSIVLIVAFLIWYCIQLELVSSSFANIVAHRPASAKNDLIIGTGFGCLIAVLAMGGIRFIKWICAFGFLILLLFVIYVFVNFEHSTAFEGNWGLSVGAISATIGATLVGMINIPTFFKHSRSKADSFIGLTLMTIFTALLESSSIFLRYDKLNQNLSNFIDYGFNYFFILMFILTSLICINMVNIYFASAGIELMLSRIFKFPTKPMMEYAIVGLMGTALFGFVPVSSPMLFLVNLAADFLVNLGIVLALAFLVSIIIKHRARELEKFINTTCWFIGCSVSLITQIQHPQDPSVGFISGIGGSILAFLVAAFIAETTWSLKIIRSKRIHKRA